MPVQEKVKPLKARMSNPRDMMIPEAMQALMALGASTRKNAACR